MANKIIGEDTGVSMEYIHIILKRKLVPVWKKTNSKEIERIAQGLGGMMKGIENLPPTPQKYYKNMSRHSLMVCPVARLEMMALVNWTYALVENVVNN